MGAGDVAPFAFAAKLTQCFLSVGILAHAAHNAVDPGCSAHLPVGALSARSSSSSDRHLIIMDLPPSGALLTNRSACQVVCQRSWRARLAGRRTQGARKCVYTAGRAR